MTSCADTLDRFLAHLDGALLPDDAAPLDDHLRTCDACRSRLAEAAALHRDLAILAASRPAVRRRGAAWPRLAMAASLLACAGVFYAIFTTGREPSPSKQADLPWGRERVGEVQTLRGDFVYAMFLSFSPDGRTLASAHWDGTVRLWDVSSGTERRKLSGHQGHLRGVAWSADGRRLASAGADHTVRIWDAGTGEERAVLRGHADASMAVAFQPGGRLLASAGYDRKIVLWDAETGDARTTLEGHGGAVVALSFSGDGRVLASGAMDGTARLWDVEKAAELRSISTGTGSLTSVVLRDGVLVTAGERTIQVWDAAAGRMLRTLAGHTDWVDRLALAPDGRTLASAGREGLAKVWDLETGKELESFGQGASCYAVAFAPDGRTLASGGHAAVIKVWGRKS